MKIQTDQLTALQQSAGTASDAAQKPSDAFASLLAKEVGEQSTQETTGLPAPVLAAYSALDIAGSQATETAEATETTEASTTSTEKERAVMENMDSLLTQWQDYADQIAAGVGGDSLKRAYGVLQNIETGVQQLKDGLPTDASSDLGSLVNELEVMAVTEKIKFNRGDYTA